MKTSLTLFLFVSFSLLFAYCTKNAQVVAPVPSANSNELLSYKTSTVPTIDGTIDAIWDNATKVNLTATVPDPGSNLFTGYIGETYTGTLRSMYDGQYIYFLAEIRDNDKSIKSAPWYFNPTTKLWAKEGTSKSFDANGVMTRIGFGEDKFSMLWNVNNSTAKFATQTCYASCHVFGPYLDYSKTPAAMSPGTGGNHYTNGVNEKIDMWWLHPNRGLAFGNMDDNYQDWAGGPTYTAVTGGNGNGRHFDDLVLDGTKSATWPFRPAYTADATQGSIANTQNLKLDGTGTTVAVPKWIIPGSAADFIKAADTLAGGTAKLVTAVSSTGVLTYNGGTIDPTVGTEYQRLGTSATAEIGAKCFPGNIVAPVLRGRADIGMSAVYTGSGWIYEYKRLLKTTDVLNQDVDFSSLNDQPFGVAFWNRCNNQHGIHPGLLLRFQK
ncbi:MAG: ethylbenzene dehydrogenase-related protein [Sediminibacterium sp.]